MLIRIAPEMFIDDGFGCRTVAEIRDEIFQTQKFKEKYPWRTDYKDKIIPIRIGAQKKAEVEKNYRLISNMIDSGIRNRRGRYVDLSYVINDLSHILWH
jgi:hypothetical protein